MPALWGDWQDSFVTDSAVGDHSMKRSAVDSSAAESLLEDALKAASKSRVGGQHNIEALLGFALERGVFPSDRALLHALAACPRVDFSPSTMRPNTTIAHDTSAARVDENPVTKSCLAGTAAMCDRVYLFAFLARGRGKDRPFADKMGPVCSGVRELTRQQHRMSRELMRSCIDVVRSSPEVATHLDVLLASLLSRALEERASGLHLAPLASGARARRQPHALHRPSVHKH